MEPEHDRLLAEIARLRLELRERYGVSRLVANSDAMRRLWADVVRLAGSPAPFLVVGEPGSGKSLVARAVHLGSGRAPAPLVAVSCASLPASLLDAQLFGSVAPDGAAAKRGALTEPRVDAAAGGTLLIEQVGSLGLLAQARLLAVMEGRSFERPSGGAVRADVRVIGSTSANLEALVQGGTLRRDFHARLSEHTLVVPPLRERLADLPALAEMSLDSLARAAGRPAPRLSEQAMQRLLRHPWPANVRELRACLEFAVGRATGPVIHEQHLPPGVRADGADEAPDPVGLEEALAGYEKELLQDALTRTHGVRSTAARLLRTTERIFNYKLRRHGIDSRLFKRPE